MRFKKQTPKNFPLLACVECGAQLQGYEKWNSNEAGELTLAGRDIWPTYFRDVGEVRVEFCSAQCGLSYCQKNSLL